MKKIILLNGPPGSGKDTLAEAMCKRNPKAKHYKFADRLCGIAAATAGMPKEEFEKLMADRNLKITPSDKLFGNTPRDFVILLAEVVYKPNFGKYFFGDAACEDIRIHLGRDPENCAIFSDLGFPEELESLINKYGESCIEVIHVKRRGCDFLGDSRNYIPANDLGVDTRIIHNKSNVLKLLDKIEAPSLDSLKSLKNFLTSARK